MLLSRDEVYAVRALVTVAPVTTRIRGLSFEVPLGPEDGLQRPCVANVDTITTIGKQRLRARVALLSPAKRQALDDAIRFALGLEG